MNKNKLVFILVFIISIYYSAFSYAGLSDIDAKRRQLEELERQLMKSRKSIEMKRIKEANLQKVLYKIKRDLRETTSRLEDEQLRLYKNKSRLEITEKKLSQAKAELDQKITLLSERLKDIYKNGSTGYLELFFSSKSISSFLDSSYFFQRLINKDIDLVKQIKQKKEEIEIQKKILLSQKRIIEDLTKSISLTKEKISLQKNQHEYYLRVVESERIREERNYQELLRNSNEIRNYIRSILAQKRTIKRQGTGRFIWPTQGYISSNFGYRVHPIYHVTRMHTGVDIAAPMGRSILAADDGEVIFTGYWGGYGKATIIAHGKGITTVYAHQSRILVSNGQAVKKGEVIGSVGSTGWSTGPHLHFEVRIDGKPVNPLGYL